MKFDIYPVKICVKVTNEDNKEELRPIVTIVPEAVEDTFNKEGTIPTVSIKFAVDSNNAEDIAYLHDMMWFNGFVVHTGIYNLINRVNFACGIEINKDVEFSDDVKNELNHIFEHFIEHFKAYIDDRRSHVIIWPDQPVFTITVPDPVESEESKKETPAEEPPIVPEVVEENEPVSE